MRVPHHAQVALDSLEDAGFEAYVVGGCVRDSLMGGIPLDWDCCTNATPKESLRVFKSFHCIKTGLQHGTITVMVDKQPIELTTYRLDGSYTDNRHPDAVTFVSDLREDLARRDFTINAMAYSPRRGLVDCFGGQADLASKLIRCVGVPTERFHEDGLRIMRALRFASRFEFGLDAATTDAVRTCRALLVNVSVERIYKELKGILVGKAARKMMLDFPELFETILPELADFIAFAPVHKNHPYGVWEHTALVVESCPADPVMRLAALFHDVGKVCVYRANEQWNPYLGHPEEGARIAKKILRRLKSDVATIDAVCLLVGHHDVEFPTRISGMRRLIGKLGVAALRQLFELRRADLLSHQSDEMMEGLALLESAKFLLEETLKMPDCYHVSDLAINGNDLMAMGLKAGPGLRFILEYLLHQVQDDALVNDYESLARAARVQMEQASQ